MSSRRAQSTVKWVLVATALIVTSLLVIWAILRFTSPSVVVTEAVEGPVVQAFYSTGTVQPEREHPIKANVAGTITAVKVDKGDKVKEKDILAIVSDPALQYQVDKAQAELRERVARADPNHSPILQEFDAKIAAYTELVEIAQREVDRIKGLIERNAGRQADLDAALDRVKKNWSDLESFKAQRASKQLELQKDVDVARAALATAQWNLDQQTLKSPTDGVVLDRPTPLGTHVAINDSLMRVARVVPESLVLRAAVDEEDIAKTREGQLVRLTLYAFPGRAFEGKVTRIYDQADPDRRTFEVDVRLSDLEPRLLPGMTGELAFIMDSKDRAIIVPSQAVQKGAVYVVQNNRLHKRDVQLGLRSVERTEILSGLKIGERVVISPVTSDSEGQRVRPEYMDPISAAGLNKPPPIEQPFKAFSK